MDQNTMHLFVTAFKAMQSEVEKYRATGTGVVAYLADRTTIDWQLCIHVFGKIEVPPVAGSTGWNVIGTACGKAAESMLTHEESGSAHRTPMRGEVGIPGALIEECGAGYAVAGFSGAQGGLDRIVAQAGVAAMLAELA